MLYQPTPREIAATVARGMEKHLGCKPLADRLQRAEAILADIGRLYFDGHAWHCESSTSDEMTYTVSFHGCTCPDASRTRDLVAGRPFCKHRLALLAYREILAGHIQTRCLGTYYGSNDYRRLKMAPNAGLLLSQSGALLCCANYYDRGPTPLCHTQYTPRGQTPATEVDLWSFAEWLRRAEAMPSVAQAWQTYDRLLAAGNTDAVAAAAADEALIAHFAADERW